MEKELFGAIRDNYNHSSDNLWKWYRRQNFFTKIIVFIWILLSSITMKVIGFIFGLGVILDKMSVWLQSKRKYFINLIDSSSSSLWYNKFSYISAPIVAFMIAPIALVFGLIPKWSSTIAVAVHPDFDVSTGIDHGYFAKLGKSYLKLAKELFKNINKHGYFFMLPALIVSLLTAPFISIISLVFFILILLDFIGWIVGLIRKFVVSSSSSLAKTAGNSFGRAVAIPIIMTLFVPLYITLLLIPKIATYDDV